jgi:peptidyl-dipeptidase Dcp
MEIDKGPVEIRTELRPGDLGYVTYLHGRIYQEEYGYGIGFEAYVAQGFYEFYSHYDPLKDRVWICEHAGQVVGFLLLMHREDGIAQLRYFILEKAYRGLGLGKKLMELFMQACRELGYARAYLWTTHELDTAASLYKRFGFVLTEEKPSELFGKLLFEQKYEWRRD